MASTRDSIIGGISRIGQEAAGFGKALAADPASAATQLQRLLPMVGSRTQGIISNTALGIFIVFQKNPESVTEESAVDWTLTNIQGQANPLMSFSCRGAKHRRFDILIDAHATPHPLGHIGRDLDNLEMLTVPYDKAGKPLIIPPQRGIGLGRAMTTSDEVVGVPPIVKLVYGGRIETGFINSLMIEETLHGTTPQAKALVLPTRANVSFDWVIIEDPRMLITFTETMPTGGSQMQQAIVGGLQFTP